VTETLCEKVIYVSFRKRCFKTLMFTADVIKVWWDCVSKRKRYETRHAGLKLMIVSIQKCNYTRFFDCRFIPRRDIFLFFHHMYVLLTWILFPCYSTSLLKYFSEWITRIFKYVLWRYCNTSVRCFNSTLCCSEAVTVHYGFIRY